MCSCTSWSAHGRYNNGGTKCACKVILRLSSSCAAGDCQSMHRRVNQRRKMARLITALVVRDHWDSAILLGCRREFDSRLRSERTDVCQQAKNLQVVQPKLLAHSWDGTLLARCENRLCLVWWWEARGDVLLMSGWLQGDSRICYCICFSSRLKSTWSEDDPLCHRCDINWDILDIRVEISGYPRCQRSMSAYDI